MSENSAHFKVEKGSARNFGIVFAIIFLLIGAVPYFFSGNLHYWALVVGSIFGLITLFKPALLEPLNTLWFKFGLLLGAIIAPLVMMLVYFLVVTPTGLLLRLFGKDPLRLKKETKSDTYWIPRQVDDENPNSMKNQF